MKWAEIKNQKSELRLSFLNPYLKLIYLVPIHMHSVNKFDLHSVKLTFQCFEPIKTQLFKILILLPFCWQAPYVLQT